MAETEAAVAVHSELLLELAFLVNERKSVDEVFASFAGRLLEAADFDYTTLLTGEPGSGHMDVVASYPFELPGATAGVTVSTSSFRYDELVSAPEGYEYVTRSESTTAASRELAGAGMSRVWVAALVSDGRVYGAFTIARKRPDPFSDDERQFVYAASRLLTAAVRQEMDLGHALRAAARAEAVNELALALNAGERIEESFQRLTELVTASIAADYVGLIMDRGEGFALVDESPSGVHQGVPATEEGTRYILENLAATNFSQARPRGDTLPSHALVDAGFKRVAVAVLRENEHPAGLLLFGRKRSLKFNEDEQAFIELVRSLLSQSLTNSRRLARSEAEAARSQTLNEVALLLNRGETVEAIFGRLLEVLEGALELDYVALMEISSEPQSFRMVGSRPVLMREDGELASFDELRMDLLLQAEGPVVQYGLEGLVDASPFTRTMYDAGMRRGVSVLIRDSGDVVGFLSLARKRGVRLDRDEAAFIGTLSAMLGQAIANQRRLQRAQVAAARAAVLNEAAMLLKRDEHPAAMFASLLPVLRPALPFDYMALLEIDAAAKELVLVAAEPFRAQQAGVRLPVAHELVSRLGSAPRPALQFQLSNVGDRFPGLQELREAGMQRGAAALLRQGGEIVGMFTLERRDPARLDDDEMAFILTLANMLGQAIANRRRVEATERQAARSRLINEIAVQLDAGETLEELFGRLPGVLSAAVDFDHVSLLAALPDFSGLRVVGASPTAILVPGAVIPWPADRQTRRRLNRRAVVQFNPHEAKGTAGYLLARAGYQSAITAVLRDGDDVLGSLQFARNDPAPFTSEESAFIEMLANLLARAVANQVHLARARADAARTHLLNALAVLLHNGEGPAGLFSRLGERLREVIAFDALSLLVAEGPNRLRVVDSLRRKSMQPGTLLTTSDIGNAAEHLSGQDLVWECPIGDIAGPVAREAEQAGIRRAAIVALRHNQESAGYLFIARLSDQPFTAEECAYFEILGTIIAQAIANHRKIAASEAEAIRSQVLSELALLLQQGEGVTDRFDRLSDLLLQAVGFDHISVTVRHPETDGWRVSRSHELTFDGKPIEVTPEAIAVLTDEGKISAQYRTADGHRPIPVALSKAGFQRGATALIRSSAGIEGVVTIGRHEDEYFDDKEMAFIELVAALLGQASANHRKAWVMAQEAEEQAIIAEAASAVARELTSLHITRALRESVGRFIPAPFCNFGFLEAEKEQMRFPAPNQPDVLMPIGPGFRQALATGQAVSGHSESEAGSAEAQVEVSRIGLQAHILTAAQSAGETVGILVIGSRAPAFDPGEREARLARLIADIVGPAMANVRAVERQRQEAEDQRLLAQVAAVAAREGEPSALLAALHQPMRAIVPSPTVIFGFREGDMTAFPRLDGSYSVVPLDPYMLMLDDVGQIHSDELPEDLFAESELWQMGLHAISSTGVKAGGKTVGYLMVASRAEGFTFGERELRLFRLLAQIVGPAMENARAALRARSDAEEQSILAEAAAALAAGATEEQILATLTPAIRRILPGAVTAVFYLDGDELHTPDGQLRDRFRPLAKEAMESGQLVVERPWPELSEVAEQALESAGIVRFIDTALNAGGESTGILFTGVRDESVEIGERELRLIRLIADMAGPAIANARESTRRRQDAEEQRFLAETAAVAASSTSEGELVRGMAKPFETLIPGSKIDLFYLHDEQLLSTITGMLLPMGQGFAEALINGQWTGRAGSPGTSYAAARRQKELQITHAAATRLSSGGQALGLFWIGTTREEPLSERDLRICRLVADVVGPALANLRESSRRKDDAEEQRFLAETAAAAASAATEDELVRRLAAPFKELVPGSRVDLFYFEGDALTSTVMHQRFPIGPNFEAALRDGQHVLEPHHQPGTPEAAEGLARLAVIQAVSTRLSSGGKALGLLWIGTTDAARPVTERDLRIFRLVADVVGPALANLRESDRRKQDAEDQRFLAEVASSVARATAEDELIGGLQDPFQALKPGTRIAFFFRDGEDLRGPDNERFGIGPQILRAFRDGQSDGHIDDEEVLAKAKAYMRKEGVVRWVNTTASSEGEILGILQVSLRGEGSFSERELRLYRLAANIVGPAMAHLRENARRAREAEDERILANAAALAAVSTTPDELMIKLPEVLAAFVPDAFVTYGIAEGDEVLYRVSPSDARELVGDDELRLPLTAVGIAARESGQGVGSLSHVSADWTYASLRLHAYSITAYHSVGSALGMLLVASRDPEYQFASEDLALLRRIAQVVGPAIDANRAELERARQAGLYSLMLHSLSEGVILADKTGRPVFSNALGRRILSTLNPAAGSTWQDVMELLPEEAREPFRGVFEDHTAGRGRSTLTIDGEVMHIDYQFVPLNDPQMKLLAVITDVTADVRHGEERDRNRERLEQAARLAALGELIGGVAHELNNPLTAVVGFAELMSANPAAEPLAEEIAVIQKEARRAADIVRDLLFIARPGTTERTNIMVSELVGHIERIRRAHWIGAGIESAIAIDPGCQVWGNEHQLTQVILNLVTNAEQALAGQSERRLALRATSADGRTVISVSDSGAGMDEATRARIWEPFFTTRPGVGTGLGLPLSYSIIQSHHGTVTVVSGPGEGTVFRVDLPSGPDEPIAPREEPRRDGATARVLVIDDEPSLRKVCQRLVTSLGHGCDTAENSEAALELARTSHFDLVLCDYRLAAETADRVIEGFAKVAPELIGRTVIATGATTDAGVLDLVERHQLQLIAKPYGVEELSRIINLALARAAHAEA